MIFTQLSFYNRIVFCFRDCVRTVSSTSPAEKP